MVRVPEVSKAPELESCMPLEINDAFRQDGQVWIPRCSEHVWGTIICPVLLDGVVAPSSSNSSSIDCSKLTSLLPLLFEKLLGSEASGGSEASSISQPVINVDSSKTEAGALHVTVALASRPALSVSELFEVETPLGIMTLRIDGLRDSSENISLDSHDLKQDDEEEPRVLLLDIPGEWLEPALLEEAYCGVMVDVDDTLPGYSAPTRWRAWLSQFGSLKQLRVCAHTAGSDGHAHLVAEYTEVSSRRICERALGAEHLIAVKESGSVQAAFPRVSSELKSEYESRARVSWNRLVLLEAEVSQADRALVTEEAQRALPAGPAGRCLSPLLDLLVAWIERGTLNATETLRAQLRLQEEKGMSRGAPTDLYRHACWDAALHAALRLPKDSFDRESHRFALVLCEHWREAYGICSDPDEEDIGALVVALQTVTESRGREERELFETAEAEARSAEEALLKALEEEEGRSQKSRERLEKKKLKEREKRKERVQEQRLEREREQERQQALRQAAREQKEREEEQKRKEREQLQAAEVQNSVRSPSKKSPKTGPKHNATDEKLTSLPEATKENKDTDSYQPDLSKSSKNAATDSSKSCELQCQNEMVDEARKEPAQETQSSSSGSPRLSGQPEEEPMPATPSRAGSGVSSSSTVSQKSHHFQTQSGTSGYSLSSAAPTTQDAIDSEVKSEANPSTPSKKAEIGLPASAVQPRRERWSDAEVFTPPSDALQKQVQQNDARSKRGPLFDAAMKQAVSSSSNVQQRHAADEVLEAVRKSDELNQRHKYPPATMQPQKQQGVVVKPPAQPIHSTAVPRPQMPPSSTVSGNMWSSPSKAASAVNQQAIQAQVDASPTTVPPSPSRRRRGGRRRGQASDISNASGDTNSTMASSGDASPRERQEFRSPNAAITWKDLGGDVMNPMTLVHQTPPQARWMPQPYGVIEEQQIAAQRANQMLGWSCAASPPAPTPAPPPPPGPPPPQVQHEWPHCTEMQYAADPHWHMNCGDSQMLSSPMACSNSPMALGCISQYTSQSGYASSSPMASPMNCQQSPMNLQQPVPPIPVGSPMNSVGVPPHQGDAAYQWLAGEAACATPMDLAAQLNAVAQTVYED